MKNVTALALCCVLILSSFSTAFANNTPVKNGVTETAENGVDINSTLLDIPLFIIQSKEPLLEEDRAFLDTAIADKYTIYDSNAVNVQWYISMGVNKEVEVTLVGKDYLNSIYSTPSLRSTYRQVADLLCSGIAVKSIKTYFVGSSADSIEKMLERSGNYNDPTYWESLYPEVGIYQGYKMLYGETEIDVETQLLEEDNITSSFQWSTFLSKSIKSLGMMAISGNNTYVTIGLDTVSNILGSVQSPMSVTYGIGGGYIKHKVVGTLYVRTIFIRDLDNRVNGYAYYDWGTVEQTKLQQHLESKYPISQRTPTTYNYLNKSGDGTMYTKATSNFYISSGIKQKVYNAYKNTSGYFPYIETLDVSSIVRNII